MVPLRERSIGRLKDAAPGWLVEVLQPAPARPPWGRMAHAAIALLGPIVVAMPLGQPRIGLVPAIGALTGVMSDSDGPYRARTQRMVAAALSSAAGFAAGHAAHGQGWWAVLVVAAMSLVSALVSTLGGTGSIFGLDLLIMTVIGIGIPVAGPPLLGSLLVLAGGAWAFALAAVVWPFRPQAAEKAQVAEVYRALGRLFDASGPQERAAFTTTQNRAYRTVLSARSAAAGPDARRSRLVALLNQASVIRQALVSLRLEHRQAPAELARTVTGIADKLATGALAPECPHWRPESPADRALRTAVKDAWRLAMGAEVRADQVPVQPVRRRERLRDTWEKLRSGRLTRLYTVRLTLCMTVAGAVTMLTAIDRSYWVMLTVAIVLKPDFGSVFARAIQRGLGTVVGAVLGAIIVIVLPDGPPTLAAIGVLAALTVYGKQRNWGMMSTFQAPLVVLLIDLQTHAGWRLAETRLLDTLIGCAIVLLLGYLPWPTTWQAPIRPRVADTLAATADYLRDIFEGDAQQEALSRRSAYDALADLRTVFQRALAEPPVVSRRITTWYPALTELERVTDGVAAVAARSRQGARPPAAAGTKAVIRALDQMADEIREGRAPPDVELHDVDVLEGVNSAVLALCGSLSEQVPR